MLKKSWKTDFKKRWNTKKPSFGTLVPSWSFLQFCQARQTATWTPLWRSSRISMSGDFTQMTGPSLFLFSRFWRFGFCLGFDYWVLGVIFDFLGEFGWLFLLWFGCFLWALVARRFWGHQAIGLLEDGIPGEGGGETCVVGGPCEAEFSHLPSCGGPWVLFCCFGFEIF